MIKFFRTNDSLYISKNKKFKIIKEQEINERVSRSYFSSYANIGNDNWLLFSKCINLEAAKQKCTSFKNLLLNKWL